MPDNDLLLDDPLLAKVPVYEGYKVLGQVVLYQKLAQSETGAVYRGRHVTLSVDVAVKVMRPDAGTSPGPGEAERLSKSFQRRMRTASTVKHDNLLRTYGSGEEHGVRFIVMPFVEGETAAERLARSGRLAEYQALEICKAVADGLAAAHKREMVHRELSPDRIFIDKAGKVLVGGLGQAEGFEEEEVEVSVDAPRRRAPRAPRSWESKDRRGPAAAKPVAGGLVGEDGVDKDLESFVRRYVRSAAHQAVLTHLARRGTGPANPEKLARSLEMKPADVRAILEDWQERGFIGQSGPYPFYYAPGQKENSIIMTFLREWNNPAQRKLLMAMIPDLGTL